MSQYNLKQWSSTNLTFWHDTFVWNKMNQTAFESLAKYNSACYIRWGLKNLRYTFQDLSILYFLIKIGRHLNVSKLYLTVVSVTFCCWGKKNNPALAQIKDYPHLLHHLFIVLRSILHCGLNKLLLYCCTIFPGASIQWCHQHTFANRGIMTAQVRITAAGNKQNSPSW